MQSGSEIPGQKFILVASGVMHVHHCRRRRKETLYAVLPVTPQIKLESPYVVSYNDEAVPNRLAPSRISIHAGWGWVMRLRRPCSTEPQGPVVVSGLINV